MSTAVTDRDLAVLVVLQDAEEPGLWLTALGVACWLRVSEACAARSLRRLCSAGLVVGDRRHPAAFARTSLGRLALAVGGAG